MKGIMQFCFEMGVVIKIKFVEVVIRNFYNFLFEIKGF